MHLGSSLEEGKAAKEAEKRKTNKYAIQVAANGQEFIPAAFETGGCWGKAVPKILRRLKRVAVDMVNAADKEHFERRYARRANEDLSIIVAKAQANMLTKMIKRERTRHGVLRGLSRRWTCT